MKERKERLKEPLLEAEGGGKARESKCSQLKQRRMTRQ